MAGPPEPPTKPGAWQGRGARKASKKSGSAKKGSAKRTKRSSKSDLKCLRKLLRGRSDESLFESSQGSATSEGEMQQELRDSEEVRIVLGAAGTSAKLPVSWQNIVGRRTDIVYCSGA